jgi:sugar/nucleoside kinase (ribokinase family)
VAKGIFVGLSTIDVVYGVDEFPAINAKVVAKTQELFVGGPATNASVVFAQLGGRPTLVSAVGRHSFAAFLTEEFRRHSIQLSDIHPDFTEAPVISSVSINKSGDRNVISANSTRVDAPTSRVDDTVLQGASVLMVDGHYMGACQAWAAAAKLKGVPVVLDGGSWKDGTEVLLRSVDMAVCSADFKPPGCTSDDEVFVYLKEHGVGNRAITNGAEPVKFATSSTEGVVRVPQVEVADTLGAGDFLHGAFCFNLASGCGFVEALVEGTVVASLSCRFHGTREWLNHLR